MDEKTKYLISRIKDRFGDGFKFDKTAYVNKRTPFIVTCKIHGDLKIKAENLFRKNSTGPCCYCGNVKTTATDFIKRATTKHNNFYDYSKVNFVNMSTKVTVICPKHGEFFPTPSSHVNGKTRCPKCAMEDTRLSDKTFKKMLQLRFNNAYDLSKVHYLGQKKKVIVGCSKHGFFKKEARLLLAGFGCPVCSHESVSKDTEKFISDLKDVYGNDYDYSKVEYYNTKTKVKLICPRHGIFEKTPNSLLTDKGGCPVCKESNGERAIRIYLEKNNIEFVREYKLDGYLYRWDFYLPKQKLFIEFNGLQHYQPVEIFGGIKSLLEVKQRDAKKRSLAKKYKIKQIEIPYYKYSKVNDILDKEIHK